MTPQDEQKLRAGRGQFNFLGILVEQVIGGWKCHNVLCSTPDEVEQVLKKGYKSIEDGIVRVREGFVAINDKDLNNGL